MERLRALGLQGDLAAEALLPGPHPEGEADHQAGAPREQTTEPATDPQIGHPGGATPETPAPQLEALPRTETRLFPDSTEVATQKPAQTPSKWQAEEDTPEGQTTTPTEEPRMSGHTLLRSWKRSSMVNWLIRSKTS